MNTNDPILIIQKLLETAPAAWWYEEFNYRQAVNAAELYLREAGVLYPTDHHRRVRIQRRGMAWCAALCVAATIRLRPPIDE